MAQVMPPSSHFAVPPGWQEAIGLVYPGDDPVGSLWETPPWDEPLVREALPEDRPPFIAVLGSSGFRASWQTGIADVMEKIGNPVRLDLASGGTVPGLAVAAGIARGWRRLINAGAPSHKVLRPLQGLRWFERRNLDLAGTYDLRPLEDWLAAWLEWAGVTTFRDLRYRPGDPRPEGVEHRAGICVSMWRTREAFPARCTSEQLADPEFIRRAFRWAFFGRQFPLRQFKQVWVPDTIGDHLPWLKDEIDDHSPAFWARVSMSQWPACLPTVLQDPRTRELVFFTDGGHIDNQPSLFNDGRIHAYPLLNPRLAQHRWQDSKRQAIADARRMPFGAVVRFPMPPEADVTLLEGPKLTLARRDAMWRSGVAQGRRRLPTVLTALSRTHAERLERLGGRSVRLRRDVPALHGFQAIAAARRADTRTIFGFRS